MTNMNTKKGKFSFYNDEGQANNNSSFVVPTKPNK